MTRSDLGEFGNIANAGNANAVPDPTQHLTLPPEAAPQGLPDVGDFARLANELFKDAPLSLPSIPGAHGADVGQLVLSPLQSTSIVPPPPARPSIPAGNVIPQSIPGSVAQAPAGVLNSASFNPSSANPISNGPTNAFSFLDEARSLFSAAPTLIEPAAIPSFGLPFEGELKDLSALRATSGIDPIQASPIGLAGASLPPLAGVPTTDLSQGQRAVPGFFREATPIVPINVYPTVSPVTSDLNAPLSVPASAGGFDVQAIRRDFPILSERVNGRQLIWLITLPRHKSRNR